MELPHCVLAAGPAAPRLGFVDDVVVNQGCGVNDFHHRAQANGAPSLVVEQFCRQQQQRRTDTLAAATPQIFANLSDGFDARDRVPPKLALNGRQVFAQKLEDFFSVDGRGHAHVVFLTTEARRNFMHPSCSP